MQVKMMRTQIINDIVNEMINILIIDYKESESNSHDKKFIDYKYYNHMTINAIIKKITPLCIRDYSSDIIRDEVYASLYEVIVNKVAPDFTDEELKIILNDIHTKVEPVTNKFLVSLNKLTILRAKLQLSGHRRGSKGMIPARDELEYSEEIFNNSPTHNYGLEITNPDDDISFFTSWFNENCANFLTDKQLQFIDDSTSVERKNHSQYKKRIYNKTLDAYEKQFEHNDERINKIHSQLELIESILESDDFVAQIIKHRDKQVIMDALTSYVPLEVMRAFNSGYYSDDKVLKHYRIALFKQMNNLNHLKSEIMK
jgi:hypothetical protein